MNGITANDLLAALLKVQALQQEMLKDYGELWDRLRTQRKQSASGLPSKREVRLVASVRALGRAINNTGKSIEKLERRKVGE